MLVEFREGYLFRTRITTCCCLSLWQAAAPAGQPQHNLAQPRVGWGALQLERQLPLGRRQHDGHGAHRSLRPVERNFSVPLFAACTLNATGQSRVILSLRKEHLRAICGPRQEERALKSVRKRFSQAGTPATPRWWAARRPRMLNTGGP